MLTKTMKLISIAALALTAALWSYAPHFALPLRFVVGLSALLVAIQALRARRRYWAAGFFLAAIVFNPFAAVIALDGSWALLVVLATGLSFALSLTALKTQPLLSIPSITDRTPGSESL